MKATTLRVLALLLVAIMMVGMFAGCAQETPTTTAGNNNTTAGGNNNTTTGKKEIKELTIQMENGCGGEVDFKWAMENTNVGPAITALLEEYGVKINWVPVETDQYGTFLTTTFAGGLAEMADIVYVGNGNLTLLQEAVEAELLLAIQDILEYSDGTAAAIYEAHPYYFGKNNLEDGKTYWIGEIQTVSYKGEELELGRAAPTTINVRTDWLETLGMEVPNTLDELEAYIKACQDNDLNGNGLRDEIFCARWSGGWTRTGIEEYYGVSTNGNFPVNLKTGEVVATWKQDGIKDVIKKIQEWHAKGYIHAEAFVGGSSSTWQRNNMCAAVYTYSCDNWSADKWKEYEGCENSALIACNPDLTVHPNAYVGHDGNPQLDVRNLCFAADADIEACARFLDCIASEEWATLMAYGVEGESYVIVDGEYMPVGSAFDYTSPSSQPNATNGHSIVAQNAIPNVYKAFDCKDDSLQCATDEILAEYEKGLLEYEVVFANQEAAYLAVATEEELEILNEYGNDFATKSKEILMAVLTGQIDIDTEWETKVIEPLKAAGMDELEAVYQARLTRYLEG